MNIRSGTSSRYSASPRRGDEVKREKLGEWGMEMTKGLESQEFRSDANIHDVLLRPDEIYQDHHHIALDSGCACLTEHMT